MRAITEQQKQEAIAAFAYEGTLIADTVYGSGHINDTFRLTFAVGNMGNLDVILQMERPPVFHPASCHDDTTGCNNGSVVSDVFQGKAVKYSGWIYASDHIHTVYDHDVPPECPCISG